MPQEGLEPSSSHDLIVQIPQENGEEMINQRSTEVFLLLFEDRKVVTAQREINPCNVLHGKKCLSPFMPREGFEPPPSPCLRSTGSILPDVTATIHHDPPRLSCDTCAPDKCTLQIHLELNLNLKQARQLPASQPIMTKSSVSFSGWFFLPPTETDVVLVHLGLEVSTTTTQTISTISSPSPVPLALPRPASLTKSPTTSRCRENSTNNNNTTNVNDSPTPRSRTNSLFDSLLEVHTYYCESHRFNLLIMLIGSPHRSTLSIDNLKPNAHSHPIRPTSTALLMPSNSTSSQQQNRGRHHCLPLPPHPSPHRERTSSNATATGDGN
ncbi:hypothetical protein C8J57DRAFT_1465459 [Mycena rebaudengoi]|nr:hypothetical protein C8J57DRAFT_1465459 [Mycena rebaudengoi]